MSTSQLDSSGKTYGLMGLARGQTRPVRTAPGKKLAWPSVLLTELLLGLGLLLVLLVIAAAMSANLGPPPNVAAADNPAPVPWFTASVAELNLRYDPIIGGIIIPSLWVLGLLLVPLTASNPIAPGTWFGGRSLGFAFAGAAFFGIIWILYVAFDPDGRLFHEINSALELTKLSGGESPGWWPTSILFFGFLDLSDLSALVWTGVLPLLVWIVLSGAALLVGRLAVGADRREMTVFVFTGIWVSIVLLTFIYGAMRGPDLALYAPWDVPAPIPAAFGAG